MKYTVSYIFVALFRLFFNTVGNLYCLIKYWGVDPTPLPPITNRLLTESATSLAQKIRTKKVSCESVVLSFLERIKEVNKILNAVVEFKVDEALEEARKVDRFLRSSELSASEIAASKPFLGVPFTAKDSFAVIGYRLTAGLYSRKDVVCDKDAEAIQRMKEAGAIFLGITNVPELCMWWESSNMIYGITNNPYDTRRTPGGSSGGEGSIISACGSPMGLGNDIGGSIRIPSCFTGIFGHKPTTGIVSNEGQVPEAVGELNTYAVTGPMCKFATDLRAMVKVLAASNLSRLTLGKKVSMNDLKIYYSEDQGDDPIVTPVDREIKESLHKVLNYFEKSFGIKPVKLQIDEFVYAAHILLAKLGSEPLANTMASEMAENKGELNLWIETIKKILGMSNHTCAALYLAIIEKVGERFNNPAGSNEQLFEHYENLKKKLLGALGDDGIFLLPCHPTAAMYHSQTLFRAFDCGYTGIFSIMGVPVTQCPLGLNSKGLPTGLQVVSNKYNDHLCLAVAEELETAFGGWVSPSQIQEN